MLERMELACDPRYQEEVVSHQIRVGQRARDFGRLIGMSETEQQELLLGGRFHDVGKMRVPLDILLKPGRLETDERTLMQCHTTYGVETLRSCGQPVPSALLDMVRYHHERWDGHGYEGVVGYEIPLNARIICLADVHDAMTADRPYRAGMSEGAALSIMVDTEQEGTVFFDPHLLRRFVAWRSDQTTDLTLSQRRHLLSFSESPVPEHALAKGDVIPATFDQWLSQSAVAVAPSSPSSAMPLRM